MRTRGSYLTHLTQQRRVEGRVDGYRPVDASYPSRASTLTDGNLFDRNSRVPAHSTHGLVIR